MIGNQQVVTDFRRILRHFQKMPSFKVKTSPNRLYVLEQVRLFHNFTIQNLSVLLKLIFSDLLVGVVCTREKRNRANED